MGGTCRRWQEMTGMEVRGCLEWESATRRGPRLWNGLVRKGDHVAVTRKRKTAGRWFWVVVWG